ncbi:uncharacterized protein LOC130805520 [Amaranthus tricolor]|uniref:uncharacterized protein LOC130805520 n=1 Tax=Amaranthus tricolor TaxID=29722 RepID=UPI002586E6C7|nr:uncharacterized protein LOC130805520 [Amaranthus tricolor]
MKKRFLEKYFPGSKSSTLKKEISNIEQNSDESFYEYWERFKRLCASCPYHGYHDEDLIMYFYNGLVNDDVRMIKAASGGSILNNTPEAARALIEELVKGSTQFNKISHDKRAIRENVSTESKVGKLEDQMQALTSMMRDFMVKEKAQQVTSCGIYSFNHPTDSCPQLQEEGWRDHPNLKYGNPSGNQQHHQELSFFKPQQQSYPRPPHHDQGSSSNSNMSTEEMLNTLTKNIIQFQDETRSSIKNIERQMGQILGAVSKLEARDSEKLPSQT